MQSLTQIFGSRSGHSPTSIGESFSLFQIFRSFCTLLKAPLTPAKQALPPLSPIPRGEGVETTILSKYFQRKHQLHIASELQEIASKSLHRKAAGEVWRGCLIEGKTCEVIEKW
jgi:hypothetical protein